MDIPVEIGHDMVILMGDCPRRTDGGTAETGDTIIYLVNHRLLCCLIEDKTIGGTDIETQPTSSAGLVMNGHFQHLSSSS